MRNQGLCSANSKQILIWKHLYLSHCYCGKKIHHWLLIRLKFWIIIIFYASFGARAINLTSLCGQFFPDLWRRQSGKKYIAHFPRVTVNWGKTGGKFNFFWISLTGENVPSLHLAGEMAGRSASCGRETAEIGPACPGDKSWRMMKNLFWRWTCKLGSTTGALRGLERLSLSRPSPSPWQNILVHVDNELTDTQQ